MIKWNSPITGITPKRILLSIALAAVIFSVFGYICWSRYKVRCGEIRRKWSSHHRKVEAEARARAEQLIAGEQQDEPMELDLMIFDFQLKTERAEHALDRDRQLLEQLSEIWKSHHSVFPGSFGIEANLPLDIQAALPDSNQGK